MAPLDRWPARMLDPACGDGAFLLGFARACQMRWPGRLREVADRRALVQQHMVGVDVDPQALRAAAQGLEAWVGGSVRPDLRLADALLEPIPERFELILGNPPYVSAAALQAEASVWRASVRSRYACARGNWDLYVPFTQRCAELLAADGVMGLVLPNTLLSAPYAQTLRSWLAQRGGVKELLLMSALPVFDAAVYPLGLIWGASPTNELLLRRAAEGAPMRWSCTRAPADQVLRSGGPWITEGGDHAALRAGLPLLEDIAHVHGAMTVSEAYALKPLLQEGGVGFKVLNTGTIDPFLSLWGAREMRYLGARLRRPVVREDALEQAMPRRHDLAGQPKVVVGGLNRTPEAFADAQGSWLAGKSTSVLLPREPWTVHALTALINSAAFGDAARRLLSGQAMRGGYLRLGPPQLRGMPTPRVTRAQVERLHELGAALAKAPGHGERRAQLNALVQGLFEG